VDSVSQALIDALQNNKPAATATVVKTRGATPRDPGAKMLIYPDGKFVGTIGGGAIELEAIAQARAAMGDGKPRYLDLAMRDHADANATMEIFVEPLAHAPTLMIVGAGHVGAAVAELARPLGFRIVVLDDRAEFITPEKFPHADERIAGDLVARLRDLEITPQTYIVLVTRMHALDPDLIGAIIETDAAYIGMLGSARRAQTVRNLLQKKGVGETALARVHAPIGIDINAETPHEIAVSILAEIIRERRGTESR
jgi:xanthine dehydrogenase accessory factor